MRERDTLACCVSAHVRNPFRLKLFPRGCPCQHQIRAEKEVLTKKLKAMESKILKGDAAGGLAEVTKKKEEELKKKEQELERRYADKS